MKSRKIFMKRKISLFFILFVLIFSSLLSGVSISYAKENLIDDKITKNNGSPSSAFEHIFGPPGHYALAISEEDNLIFTNAYEGIAVLPRDDLTNQTIYTEEIGLQDVTVYSLEVDADLKLLYIGYVTGVDVLNYSKLPYQAEPILESVMTNLDFGDFIKVDPVTHYVWIVTTSNGLHVYDPINDRMVDTSGYSLPSPTVTMLTIDVNSTINRVFIGTKTQGMFYIDTLANTTHWVSTTEGLPYDFVRVVDACPEKDKIFLSTFHAGTSVSGGLSVFFLSNSSVNTYNWTGLTYYPRAIFDIECDVQRDLGYLASPYTANAEYGLLVFNLTDISGIAKSDVGSHPAFGPPQVSGNPETLEGILGSVVLDEETREIFVGSVIRIQKIYFATTPSATTENSPLYGLQHNMVSDVNYDQVDDKFYVSTLLGLDRVDPTTRQIENLIQGAGGSGGDTSGELLETARLFYHNRERYDITAGTWILMNTILPLDEYHYIGDIASSQNESVLYYCASESNDGTTSNGSLIIYNRNTGYYKVEDFGYNKSKLHVQRALEDPIRDVLYVATHEYLILYNLTTLTEIKRFGGGLWDIRSLEWINGYLWFGLEQYPNVRIFNPTLETFSTFGKASEILYPAINDIHYIQGRQEIYILANSGLYVYNYTSGELKYESETEGLSSLFTRRMDYNPAIEVWIGSLGGLNIYDPNFDNRVPVVTVDYPSLVLSGINFINASATDYAGIKEIKATMKNSTWSTSWTIADDYLQVVLDTTIYDDGFYEFRVNVTDFNNQVESLAETIEIDNIVIGEFTAILLPMFIPIMVISTVVILRKRCKI
jgi:hypothetical protein